LYATEIISRAWNGDHIYLSSGWRSQASVVKINVTTSAVTRIASSVSGGSVSLLDQLDGKLLLVEQSPVNPYRVIIKDDNNTDTVVTECETQFNQVSWEIKKIDVDGGEIEYILLQPPVEICMFILTVTNTSANKSLMVTPHGGPHSSYTTIFISSLMYYCLHGYTICMVNYRGSPGFGQSFIEALPGNIGKMDVQDTHAATVHVLKTLGEKLDSDLVSVIGGSHGGFLSAHMIGIFVLVY
jgi:acylaminoacyl-peptidase